MAISEFHSGIGEMKGYFAFHGGSQLRQRMSGYRLVQILLVILGTLIFLALAARYKVIGYEAVRPFHFPGLIIVVLITFAATPTLLKAGILKDKVLIMGIALVSYVVIQGILGDHRSAKDAIYIAVNVMSFLALFLHLRIWKRGIDMLQVASLIVAITTFVCVGLAFLSWFILLPFSTLEGYKFIKSASMLWPLMQSSAYLSRAHGIFGDPTVFGIFCAFSAILTIQMAWRIKNQSSRIYALLLIAHLCAILGLIASGSRMSIIAFGLILTLLAYYDFRKAMVVTGYFILMIPFFFGLYYLRNITIEGLSIVSSGEGLSIVSSGEGLSILSSGNDGFGGHYLNESLRVSGIENFRDRSDRMILAIGALQNSTPISLLFGCGVECAQKRDTFGLNGYLDLIQNHGLIFMSGLIYLLCITVWRLLHHHRSNLFISTNLSIIVAVLFLEMFGYWVFTPFFNPIQLLFSYILAVAIIPRSLGGADMQGGILIP
jgi:hypothetical protein